ncbi:MAG: zf-HC2 domain-containing protein [Clostridia bacterium]|nr:zf-HC2 domain-containing protein [Clostridia bacterium]
MSKEICSLIKDLLPLYIDDVCSEDSVKIISNHLKNCSECNKEYERLANQPEIRVVNDNSTELIKGVGKMFKKDKKKAIIKTVSIFLVVFILLGVFAFLKVPLMLYENKFSGVSNSCEVLVSGDNSKSNYSNEYFDLYIDASLGEYTEKNIDGTCLLDFGQGKSIVFYDENDGMPVPTMDEHKVDFIQSLKYPVVYSFIEKGIENYGYSTDVSVTYNYKMMKDFISGKAPKVKLFSSFEDYTKACAYYACMEVSVLSTGGKSHYIVSENDKSVGKGHYIVSMDAGTESYQMHFQSKEDLSKIYAIRVVGFTEEETKEVFKYIVMK